jgi:pimeloyl-ACP methyl ester carboxylesterase
MQMRKRRIALLIVVVGFAAAMPFIDDHLQAVTVMLHVMDPETKQALAKYRQLTVREESLTLPSGIRARRYIPEHSRAKHAMVVVHGVHHLGIEEPRLMAFSRALAAQGIEVVTPELPGIADFRVTPDSITTIGEAAKYVHGNGQKVGVFGLSFSGGLALMAAADPRYRDDIAFTVAVGAHDDMGRVARFFALNEVPKPDGTVLRTKAHEYGALVLAYAHPEDFFPEAEAAAARACLRAVLYETKCEEATLPAQTRAEMKHVFAHDTEYFRDRILASAAKHEAEYAEVSPHGKLGGITSSVLLLHGAGDDVIPPSETEWLAKEIPAKYLKEVLISPAISHVEVGDDRDYWQEFRVVHFIAEMIDEAEE